MRIKGIIFFIFIILVSCSQSREEDARLVFEAAKEAYDNKDYNKSKTLLDSVIYSYNEIEQFSQKAKNLLNEVNKAEQEHNLAFLDSLLTMRESEVQPLLKEFYVEDETLATPVLIHKKQATYNTVERSYIRAHVDKNGNFYMSSHYTGERYINHNQIKVEIDDMYLFTDSIVNDAYIHSFDDEGQVWEIVKYKNGSDNGTANFIARNYDKRIVVSFIGPRSKYRFVMMETDKIVMRDTYNLAVLLREIVQIKNQIKNIESSLKKIQQSSIILR